MSFLLKTLDGSFYVQDKTTYTEGSIQPFHNRTSSPQSSPCLLVCGSPVPSLPPAFPPSSSPTYFSHPHHQTRLLLRKHIDFPELTHCTVAVCLK